MNDTGHVNDTGQATRPVAVAEVEGADAALALVAGLGLSGYHPQRSRQAFTGP